MERSTQDMDNIRESRVPALSRILEGVGHQLEEEFRRRLDEAILEAQDAANRQAESQKEQALAQAREELSAEVNSQVSRMLEEAREKMQVEFDDRLRASEQKWNAEKADLQDEVNVWRIYAEVQRRMGESRSQAEILSNFMDLGETFAANIAVYLPKTQGLTLWEKRGSGTFPEVVSQETVNSELYFKPIILRGRTVAAVCAAQPFKPESLDFLGACLTRAVEAFGMRLRYPDPAVP